MKEKRLHFTLRCQTSIHQKEYEISSVSNGPVRWGAAAGIAALLHRCVLQHSLVKVKLSPMVYFSPVTPHREGRMQLFSYNTTRTCPESSNTHKTINHTDTPPSALGLYLGSYSPF